MADAYRNHDPTIFNEALTRYHEGLLREHALETRRAYEEMIFNRVQPFYQSMVMYAAVFLLIFLSWLVWSKTLNKTALVLLIFAFGIHTAGLVARIILQ